MEASQVLNWISHYGYWGIFFLLMLGIVGIPIPDELVLTCAGYFIFKGYLSPELTVTAAFLGSICGISLSYTLGRFIGTRLIREYGYVVNITPELFDKITVWWTRFGKWVLIIGYFIAGVRHLSAFIAGTSRLGITVFALFAYSGALMWSITFISLGYALGDEWTRISEHLVIETWVALGMVLGLGVLLFVRRKSLRRR